MTIWRHSLRGSIVDTQATQMLTALVQRRPWLGAGDEVPALAH